MEPVAEEAEEAVEEAERDLEQDGTMTTVMMTMATMTKGRLVAELVVELEAPTQEAEARLEGVAVLLPRGSGGTKTMVSPTCDVYPSHRADGT